MTIAERVRSALEFVSIKDFENALIQISICTDATSKKEQKAKSQSERNKLFIDSHQDFIYRFSTGGEVSVTGALNYPTGTLGRTLYKVIRCGLIHEGVLPKEFVFLDGQGLGGIMTSADINKPPGFGISAYFLLSLILLTITSPINKLEKIGNNMSFTVYDKKVVVDEIWGDRNHLLTYPMWN